MSAKPAAAHFGGLASRCLHLAIEIKHVSLNAFPAFRVVDHTQKRQRGLVQSRLYACDNRRSVCTDLCKLAEAIVEKAVSELQGLTLKAVR